MHPYLAISLLVTILACIALQALLYSTQSDREPYVLPTAIPFFEPAFGLVYHRANYMDRLRNKYRGAIHTLRLPFQRLYVVHAPYLVRAIQSKANTRTLVPNLLDFGMLFSGLNRQSQNTLRQAFRAHGNAFSTSVHRYLLSGPTLETVTRAAILRLNSLPKRLECSSHKGLLELVQHELTLALTGAIYGPKNPYNDPTIEASWRDFVPGIIHLLYSPFPLLTARKALRARSRIIGAFRKYFETGGHLEAFPMIPDMYAKNRGYGLAASEAAKMEMATSLAMLSSGAITAFWLIFHILSDCHALHAIRQELHAITKIESLSELAIPQTAILDLSRIKEESPTLMAMLHETLRYHSTVINIKQVQQDIVLADEYLLRRNGIVMIPGRSIHHDQDIWGSTANIFNHQRFLSPETARNLSSTSAFRPFGAGATMCPGRHFSTQVILSLVAMIVLQYDVLPVGGQWVQPTKRNAEMWNAMPKPDWDIHVQLVRRQHKGQIQLQFV